MAFNVVKSKWSKKDKALAHQSLLAILRPAQSVVFAQTPTNEYSWQILLLDSSSPEANVIDISHAVACVLGRRFGGSTLLGVTYDSPHILLAELQEVLGFSEPFLLGTFIWL